VDRYIYSSNSFVLQMTRTDTAGHVGGIFAGIVFFLSRRAGIQL
jgi:hypothetical protein